MIQALLQIACRLCVGLKGMDSPGLRHFVIAPPCLRDFWIISILLTLSTPLRSTQDYRGSKLMDRTYVFLHLTYFCNSFLDLPFSRNHAMFSKSEACLNCTMNTWRGKFVLSSFHLVHCLFQNFFCSCYIDLFIAYKKIYNVLNWFKVLILYLWYWH